MDSLQSSFVTRFYKKYVVFHKIDRPLPSAEMPHHFNKNAHSKLKRKLLLFRETTLVLRAFVIMQENGKWNGELLFIEEIVYIERVEMANMKIYTLKEISQKINISTTKLKQWEKDLDGLLAIPRTKQGARYYTDHEIELLLEINKLYQLHKKKETVRSLLRSSTEPPAELVPQEKEQTVSVMTSELPATEQLNEQESFFAAMDTYKMTFLSEVKNEIRSVVQKEIVTEMKKELSNGMFHTAKSLADSIYKSGAHTQAEIADLRDAVGKASDQTEKGYHAITDILENQALENSEEFFTLSKQLTETSEDIAHYIEATNNGIECLTEVFSKERKSYVEDLEQFRQEIRQREVAFQSMLSSFREAAPAKEKKWWHFW